MGLALAVALGSLACSTLPPGVSGVVDVAPAGADALRLVYLGTGGWIIEHGDDQILTAPLFTNPGLFTAGVWSFHSDPEVVDRWMAPYDVARARAILVGHAHYDHLLDVPRVANAHATRARILGSTTVANTLGTWSGLADRVDVVDADAADAETLGRWIEFGPTLRVMPLRSFHGPHFDGLTLYRGTRDKPLERAPRTADEWLDGQTFAFLVDLLDDDGSIAFRIYYQDAVAPAPAGFAPVSLIDEHPVDVAILVPATFDQVDWHPEAFIENLRPRRVLLGHWEDFFSPMDAPARSISFTDMRLFEARLEDVFDGEYWRPDRWTEFRFPRWPSPPTR